MTRIRTTEAGQAAELLGIDVWDLAHALQNHAEFKYSAIAGGVKKYQTPNFGAARRVLRAANKCWAAYEEEKEARTAATAD